MITLEIKSVQDAKRAIAMLQAYIAFEAPIATNEVKEESKPIATNEVKEESKPKATRREVKEESKPKATRREVKEESKPRRSRRGESKPKATRREVKEESKPTTPKEIFKSIQNICKELTKSDIALADSIKKLAIKHGSTTGRINKVAKANLEDMLNDVKSLQVDQEGK